MIVFFHALENKDYIKRVIGLPGDRIEYKDDILYINDEPYDEPLTRSFTLEETSVGGDIVPEGYLFVMGDNRRNSEDSRRIGATPIEQIIVTTKVVYFSCKTTPNLKNK